MRLRSMAFNTARIDFLSPGMTWSPVRVIGTLKVMQWLLSAVSIQRIHFHKSQGRVYPNLKVFPKRSLRVYCNFRQSSLSYNSPWVLLLHINSWYLASFHKTTYIHLKGTHSIISLNILFYLYYFDFTLKVIMFPYIFACLFAFPQIQLWYCTFCCNWCYLYIIVLSEDAEFNTDANGWIGRKWVPRIIFPWVRK